MQTKEMANKKGFLKKCLFVFSLICLLILGLEKTGYAGTGQEIPVGDTEFSNEGTVEQEETGGNNETIENIYGVYGADTVDSLELFDNTTGGIISTSGEVGDAAAGEAKLNDIAGTYILRDVTTFQNSGGISATATAGSSSGDGLRVFVGQLYGTRFGGTVDSFSSSGDITVTASGENAAGDMGGGIKSRVHIEQIYGARFGGAVDSFSSSGNITVTATAGSATGDDSQIQMRHIYGARFGAAVGSFSNSGNITVTATAGDADGTDSSVFIANIYGARFNGDIDSFDNTGNISVSVEGGDGATVGDVAGIYVADSTATISNSGRVYLSTNVSGADIRTLWVENSHVTLSNQFSAIFGASMITQEPIYVDGASTLALGDADFVAGADANLEFNSSYSVIENDGGTVDGSFGSLVKGYSNPDITVSWDGDSQGEDAAVIFGYRPTAKNSVAGIGVFASSALAEGASGALLMNTGYRRAIGSSAGQDIWALIDQLLEPEKEYKSKVFIYPFYTKINDKGIGFSAGAAGVTLGFESKLSKELTGGLFTGIMPQAKVDYQQGGSKDRPDIYSCGAYLDYAAEPFYVGLAIRGYAADHDYKGFTGPNYGVSENASYWSSGLDSELKAGYIFGKGKDWKIIPELGLGYSYWSLEGFSTDAAESNWNRHFQSSSGGYLKTIGTITAVKSLSFNDIDLDLLLSLQAERALTDNDISIAQSISIPALGDVVDVTQDIDDTSFVSNLGANLTFKEGMHLNLSLRSKLNSNYQLYTGKLSLIAEF